MTDQLVLNFYFDQPLHVDLDPSTGELRIRSNRVSPGMPGDGFVQITLSSAAARTFFVALKTLEKSLGVPLEQLAKPGSVQ